MEPNVKEYKMVESTNKGLVMKTVRNFEIAEYQEEQRE